jgi:hypothetical protein
MSRILWNRRPTDDTDPGDIDEIVFHNAQVHVEQTADRNYWIGVELPDGTSWSGNFYAAADGRLTFGLQEDTGVKWDDDAEHQK